MKVDTKMYLNKTVSIGRESNHRITNSNLIAGLFFSYCYALKRV